MAQAAASRTTGSGSSRARCKGGRADASPRLPRTMAALRARPRRFVRIRAVPRNRWRNSSSDMLRISTESRPARSGRGCNAGSRAAGALRFHGQTSWQMSQPKSQSPTPGRSSSGMGPSQLDGQVTDAAARIENAGADERLRGTGVEAGGAGAAVVGVERRVGAEVKIEQQSAQEECSCPGVC